MSSHDTIPAIRSATKSLQDAIPVAESDANRPLFHFRPPANWMNDPNGTYFHEGYYHLFYQHNPYGDAWGHMHWGHARSTNLVEWEDLPIALWPSTDSGEAHCFSGCATVNALGQPLIIYTSVGAGDGGERPDFEQWAAFGSKDWINWRKWTRNPVLSLQSHNGPAFEGTWRDPYLFTARDGDNTRTFMVLGANLGTRACVALYESTHPALVDWHYRGVLYESTTDEVGLCECPNFLQVDGKWILLFSPYRPVEYLVGDFDLESLRFVSHYRGVLDPGANRESSSCFYATNTAFAPDGRTILFGWIRGFAHGRGWNGCLALPRELHIDEQGQPRQKPAAEVALLRTRHFPVEEEVMAEENYSLPLGSSCIELSLDLPRAQGAIVVEVGGGEGSVRIEVLEDEIRVNNQSVELPKSGDNIDLHLYLDRSVLELFAADWQLAVTQVVPAPSETPTLRITNRSHALLRFKGDIWHLRGIW